MKIHMVDLFGQYKKIEEEINSALQSVMNSTRFIGGPEVQAFSEELASYLGCKYVIPCANGTDALQIAVMALDLKVGDEILVPAFTYAATAEVIALLGLIPVMVDVHPDTFNIDISDARKKITEKVKAIIPVHLFGQCADMDAVLALAKEYNLFVIEDNAQAIGSSYTFTDGKEAMAGTMGHIGTVSFFPSKNLGCYGDGGCLCTNSEKFYKKIKMVANHGQSKKYYHEIVGVNSRLDAIQAAILRVKLRYLDDYISHRQWAASEYDKLFSEIENLKLPARDPNSTHVFHQYTIQVSDRDRLKEELASRGIPSMVYYPLPLYKQNAYKHFAHEISPVTEKLCNHVLSLPMHSEIKENQISLIAREVTEAIQIAVS